MSTELLQNRNCRLLLLSLCALMLLSGWSGISEAEPLRRLDQIKAALAAPKAADMRAFAGQAPVRRGLLHRPPPRAFPPGPPLAMPSFSTAYVRDGISFPLAVIGLDPAHGLTQRDLGNIIGMTRESTNKQLRIWEDKKWVRLEHNAVVILATDHLTAIAEDGSRGA